MIKKILLLIFTYLIFLSPAISQISQGDWLVGGNIIYSSNKSRSELGTTTYINSHIAGTVGYFFNDKMAAGLKPCIKAEKSRINLSTYNYITYSAGPFFRYYVLPSNAITNLFIEASYSYGILKDNYQKVLHPESYSFLAGPVFFLNPAVGLELSFGYTLSKSNDISHSQSSLIQVGLGLQFHLEKR